MAMISPGEMEISKIEPTCALAPKVTTKKNQALERNSYNFGTCPIAQ